jgi:hypothetical protein
MDNVIENVATVMVIALVLTGCFELIYIGGFAWKQENHNIISANSFLKLATGTPDLYLRCRYLQSAITSLSNFNDNPNWINGLPYTDPYIIKTQILSNINVLSKTLENDNLTAFERQKTIEVSNNAIAQIMDELDQVFIFKTIMSNYTVLYVFIWAFALLFCLAVKFHYEKT